MNKHTADIIVRALLAIVAALRKEHGLPDHSNVTVLLIDDSKSLPNGDIIPIIK